MENKQPDIRVPNTLYTKFFKRFLDLVLSGTAILILSPLFLVIALLELIIHGRPILFSQQRPGYHGELFTMYKFRSMSNEKDETGNLLPGNQRLTKFGKFIRKYSLDELPELFCIFLGKMSIIGPRPLLTEYLPLYGEYYSQRHNIKPGFACVRLTAGDTWTWRDQFENDLWYVRNCSLIVDIKMIFAVVREVLHPIKNRIDATRVPFDGSNFDKL